MSAKKRVLLIEDHADSRVALTHLLTRADFDVIAYDRCEAAAGHLTTCDMDVALLDVRLPGRCGDDFGRELRSRCPKVMIVFVTAEQVLEPLKEAVPDCFVIRKPVDIAVLLELMACFCSDKGYASPMKEIMENRAGPGFL